MHLESLAATQAPSQIQRTAPRRVLFVRNARGIADLSGAESYLINLATGLKRTGCEVFVICSSDPARRDAAWMRGLAASPVEHEIVPVASTLSREDLDAVRAKAESFRPDVIHSIDHRANAIALSVAKRTGAKAVASFFGWTNWSSRSLRGIVYPFIDRRVIRRLDRIIVDSSFMARALNAGKAAGRIDVIPNGVDLLRFDAGQVAGTLKRRFFGREDIFLVGMVGRVHPNKGQLELVRAARNLVDRHPSLRFLVLGDPPPGFEGYAESVRGEIEAGGLKDRFVLSNVPSAEIPDAMASFDVLAAPSHVESFSFVWLEAMAMGTPVVSSRVGGVADLIADGKNGLLLEAGDVEGLSKSIESILTDERLHRALSRAAYATIEDGFTVDRMIQSTLTSYRKAISA